MPAISIRSIQCYSPTRSFPSFPQLVIPAEAGIHLSAGVARAVGHDLRASLSRRSLAEQWIPAFAGMTTGDRAMGQFGIGQPVRRFEDKRLLCGNGRFQSDNNLHGQAYAYVLRSPHAHARIRKLDLPTAQAVPGIALIMTGDDLVEAKLGVMGVPFQR